MDSRIDIEKTQKIVALVTEKIKAEVDPWLLDEYHMLFKKEVSLFHRSRVAAYLLMILEQGKSLRFLEQETPEHGSPRQKARGNQAKPEKNGPRKPKVGNDRYSPSAAGVRNEDSESDPNRYPLAEKDSKWLFFSVGRTRRISPREILSLINTKTSLPKDDIGAIRIFDNYSFVQVRDTVAVTLIEALNGYVFRGRPLVINYAKARKSEAAANSEKEPVAATDESPASETIPGDVLAPTEPGEQDLNEQVQDHPQEKDV